MVRRLLVLFLLGFTLVFSACTSNTVSNPEAAPSTPPAAVSPAPSQPPSTPPANLPKIVVKNLESPFRFEPNVIELKVGVTYAIELVGGKELHTFTITQLGISQIVEPNKTVSITLKVDKPGVYELICGPHLSFGMTGKIRVK